MTTEFNKSQLILFSIIAVLAVIALGIVLLFRKQQPAPVQLNAVYKKVQLQNAAGEWAEFEIPSTWSVFNNPESVGEHDRPQQPTGAIGQTDVEFGDINWSQVDFLYIQDDVVDEFTKEGKSAVPNAWSKEKVGGIVADVVTAGLDDGKVTKDGPGGKTYYVRLPGTLQTLIIDKQALGDAEFESGFQHMMQTMQFIF